MNMKTPEEIKKAMTELKPIVYNGDRNLLHARNDIYVLVQAYNAAVKKINQLEDRVKKLEREGRG